MLWGLNLAKKYAGVAVWRLLRGEVIRAVRMWLKKRSKERRRSCQKLDEQLDSPETQHKTPAEVSYHRFKVSQSAFFLFLNLQCSFPSWVQCRSLFQESREEG